MAEELTVLIKILTIILPISIYIIPKYGRRIKVLIKKFLLETGLAKEVRKNEKLDEFTKGKYII